MHLNSTTGAGVVENSAPVRAALNVLFAGLPADVPILLDGGEAPSPIASADDLAAFLEAAAEPYAVPASAGLVGFLYLHQAEAVPGEWETLTLRPSVVLLKEDQAIVVYALAEGVPLDRAGSLAESLGCDLGEPIPLPGSNGWTAAHLDEAAAYTVEELEAVFCASPPVIPPPRGAALGKLHDAAIRRPIELDDPRLAEPVTITGGAGAKAQHWKPATMTRGDVLAMFCRHREARRKDGPAVVLGEMPAGPRTATAIRALHFVGLDIDTGFDGEELCRRVEASGLMAVISSTYSHLKTETREPLDGLVQWARREGHGEEVTEELIRARLAWKGYDLGDFTFEIVTGANGREVAISHAPIPRWRVVVPLAEPFVIGENGTTDREGREAWRRVPEALAQMLGGLPIDKTGSDANRLLYLPTHAPGRPFEAYVFGGELLSWRNLPAPLEPSGAAAYTAPASGPFTRRWAAQRADGLQIADLIRSLCPERIRADRGVEIEIECPFDDEHSNPGDPEDRGCMAVNAGDGQASKFVVTCRHDHCQGRTNLDFLNRMAESGWFEAEAVTGDDFDALEREEEIDVEAALADYGSAQREEARRGYREALAALSRDSAAPDVEGVIAQIAAANLGAIELDRAKGELKKVLGISARAVNDAFAEVMARAPTAPGRKAAPVERNRALEKEYPFPDADHGAFTFKPFAGRAWTYERNGDDAKASWTRLFTPWAIVRGLVYADRQGQRGLRLKVMDEAAAPAVVDLPAGSAVAQGGLDFKVRLRELGVGMTDAGEARLVQLAKQIQPPSPLTIYDRPGWREGLFLTPWGVAVGGATAAELAADARPKGEAARGTLDDWKAAVVAAFESGVLHFQVGALAAFVSPMLDLCAMPSRLLAFTGESGRGKSTAHELQCSAWGDVAPKRGLFGSFNATDLAPELLVARSSGAGCAFDEAKMIDGRALQAFVFKVSGDAGRDRLVRSGGAVRESRHWRTFVTFSNESTLDSKIRGSGDVVTTGLGARCLELSVDGTPLLDAAVMDRISGVRRNFGHAGPAFVEAMIAQGYAADPARLEREIEALADRLVADAPTDQRRAARIAALIWKAGEIAQAAGLIPDRFPVRAQEEDGADGAGLEDMALALWRRSRQSDSAPVAPGDKAVSTLIANLIRHLGGEVADGLGGNFRAKDAWRFVLDGREVYVVSLDGLQRLSGGALNASAVIRALRKGDKLLPAPRSDRKALVWDYVKGLGNIRSVVIPASVVEDAPEPGV